MVILTLLRIRTDRQWKECRRLWLSACNRYDSRAQQESLSIERNVLWVRMSRTTGASLASYDHVSSTMERNVLWVRMSRTPGPSLASYDHVSSTIERNELWVRMSCTTGASLASYDHESSTIERYVLWVHDGRISRVVRSRIFDDREKCVMGANVSHDGRISGSSVAHCAHASGVGHLASKTQASSPTSRCRIVRAKAEESV